MELVTVSLDKIRPYDRNPRKNDEAVAAVMESIKQCTYVAPIIVDENNVILAGHTRYKALKKLGKTEAEVIVKSGLSDEQKRKYRLLDNKTNELADWDFDLLAEELKGLDFGDLELDWGADLGEAEQEDRCGEIYTEKTNIPQYEPTGESIPIEQCCDKSKCEILISEIKKSGVTDKEKSFLIAAATRHYAFNYKNCAEYYASASKEMQELMEKSALVIIDFEDAIKNGYAKLKLKVKECMSET